MRDIHSKKPEECQYSFTQHKTCEFFPCHKTEHPLGSHCGGNFVYLDSGVKDCSNCLVPHGRGSYSYVLKKFPELMELAKKNR